MSKNHVPQEEEYLTRKQTKKRLGISETLLRKCEKRQDLGLPYYKISERKKLYLASEIDAWLRQFRSSGE